MAQSQIGKWELTISIPYTWDQSAVTGNFRNGSLHWPAGRNCDFTFCWSSFLNIKRRQLFQYRFSVFIHFPTSLLVMFFFVVVQRVSCTLWTTSCFSFWTLKQRTWIYSFIVNHAVLIIVYFDILRVFFLILCFWALAYLADRCVD